MESDIMKVSDRDVPRCGSCGYRWISLKRMVCSECGLKGFPVFPLDRSRTKARIRQGLLALLAGCLPGPAAIGVAHLAVAVNSFDLYLVAMFLLILATIFSFVWIVVTSIRWVERTLDHIWSIRSGEIGPWSGRSVHFLVFAGLLTVQLTLAGGLMVLFALIPLEYPGGWP